MRLKKKLAIATYSNSFTNNIGDSVQENAIYDAIKHVFPESEIVKVLRDKWVENEEDTLNIMQGWYDVKSSIPIKGDSLFIATHLTNSIREYVKTVLPRDVNFGARDFITKALFQNAYLSRCYTMTLPKRQKMPLNGKVFLSHVSDWEEYMPSELKENCVRVSHVYEGEDMPSTARKLIERYRDEAALVITRKVHCASPCLAMGIPVIAIYENQDRLERFEFLKGIFNPYSLQDLYDGKIDWNPEPIDIEDLKKLMFENLKMSIQLSLGEDVDKEKLNAVRNSIKEYAII